VFSEDSSRSGVTELFLVMLICHHATEDITEEVIFSAHIVHYVFCAVLRTNNLHFPI